MADITVRQAEEGDREALAALLGRSWRAYWGPHVTEAARLRYAAEAPHLVYIEAHWPTMKVAVRDETLVGMFHLEGDYLEAIHVAAETMGQGIGGLMMAQAEAAGARRLDVRAFNQRARTFYLARGWREAGREAGTEMGAPVETITMTLSP